MMTPADEAALIRRVRDFPTTERIAFFEDVPAEMREAIRPHVRRAAFTLPGWCEHLYLDWATHDGDTGTAADTVCMFRYRWARVTVYSGWLRHGEYTRQRLLLHELVHVNIDPLYHGLKNMVDDLTPDKISERVVLRTLNEALEGVVEDMTNLLMTHPAFHNLSREPGADDTPSGGK
jgi:hypothetical protein